MCEPIFEEEYFASARGPLNRGMQEVVPRGLWEI
jgi:hypothetical protein